MNDYLGLPRAVVLVLAGGALNPPANRPNPHSPLRLFFLSFRTFSPSTGIMAAPRRVASSAFRLANSQRQRLFSTVVEDGISPGITPASHSPPAPPSPTNALQDALSARAARSTWTKDEIREIYNTPLMELAFKSV